MSGTEELLLALPEAAEGTGTAGGGNSLFLSELMLCIVIIGVAAYLAVDEYGKQIRAAQLQGPMVSAAAERVLWIEEYALSGMPPADSSAYDRRTSGTDVRLASAGPEALGSVSGLEALRARAAQGAAAEEQATASKADTGLKNAIVGISDGVPMAVVTSRHFDQPLIFELRPAIQAPDGAVVRWLCDAGLPPPGWAAPAARGPRIPDELLPSACRKGRKP